MARPRGTGSLYQRKDSAVWWIKYHRNGRSFRESTRTEDKRIATRILGKRLAEISTNTFVGPTHERITVGELADDLFRDYRINGRKTTDDVQTRWRLHIEPFFGSRRVMEVTSDLVAKYVDHRQSEHASNATINREMAALKRMFRIGMFATPPKVFRLPKFPKLTEDNIRTGFLEDAQYKKADRILPRSLVPNDSRDGPDIRVENQRTHQPQGGANRYCRTDDSPGTRHHEEQGWTRGHNDREHPCSADSMCRREVCGFLSANAPRWETGKGLPRDVGERL